MALSDDDAKNAATVPLGGGSPPVAAAAALPPDSQTLGPIPTTRVAPNSPERLGRFEVKEKLGEGGMGVVLLATDPQLGRRVALKVLHRDAQTPDARRRLLREAQGVAQLAHENVVVVHEVGTHEGRDYIAMEYVAGGTLTKWQVGKSWLEILAMYMRAGRGLVAAHEAGLVHRDFKPDNVLVGDDGRARVSDFGLVATTDERPAEDLSHTERSLRDESVLAVTLTRTGSIMGTPRYMAPEQHLGQSVDARADQFAFCAALYGALYGQPPFPAEVYQVLVATVLAGEIAPVPADSPVPPAIRDAILRGLSTRRDDRFPSMRELLDALVVEPPATARSRRARWVMALALALAIAAAGVAVFARRSDDDMATKQRAAAAAAQACDCALLTVEVPEGARLTGVRTLLGTPTPPTVAPNGQFAIPRGQHLLMYEVDGATYAYSVQSAGAGTAAMVSLPLPMQRAGFVFVPGGDVTIGSSDAATPADERPTAIVHLAPYLIAIHEEPELFDYAGALARTVEKQARLPTAAEWEWAARLGVVDRMLSDRWEWTGTQYVAYPGSDKDRDDALNKDPDHRVEVRGGQRVGCSDPTKRGLAPCGTDAGDAARLNRRLGAARDGSAELRLARTVVPMREIVVRFEEQHTTTATPNTAEGTTQITQVINPHDAVLLRRFVEAWRQLDAPPALQVAFDVAPSGCEVAQTMTALGVDPLRIERVHHDGGSASDKVTIRWNPVADFRMTEAKPCRPARRIITETTIEILDPISFAGERLLPTSLPIIKATAETLLGNPRILLMEVQSHVVPGTPDAASLTQRRAARVRQMLVDAGVAPDRLTAKGYGDTQPLTRQGDAGREKLLGETRPQSPKAEDQIGFLILRRR